MNLNKVANNFCKTFIHRFDSDRRLQENQQLRVTLTGGFFYLCAKHFLRPGFLRLYFQLAFCSNQDKQIKLQMLACFIFCRIL